MCNREALIHEVEQVPESLLGEISDFIHFLKAKQNQDQFETALVSEPLLARDWLKPEEDATWADL
ncbi:MAG: DUF2281 domain-containing protein [Planctomycetota bacterium]